MTSSLVIGIMALQGDVQEHMKAMNSTIEEMLRHNENNLKSIHTKQIKLPDDLLGIHGIILPGGESTAMAIIGEKWGLFPALRKWVSEKRPVWGTCAGMILLSNYAVNQCQGGQALIGGLDVKVCRNFFGSQIQSSEYELNITCSNFENPLEKFKAIFIRAPAILKVGKNVNILASIEATPHESVVKDVLDILNQEDANLSGKFSNLSLTEQKMNVIVAVRQG